MRPHDCQIENLTSAVIANVFVTLYYHRNYLNRLAEEVNDKLQEAGQVTIPELCKNYDLPGDFLTEVSSRGSGRRSWRRSWRFVIRVTHV